MGSKIPLIIAIILVVAVVVLVIIFGPEKEGKEGVTPEEEGPTIEEGVEIAEEIYGVSGEIKEIKGKTLMVEAWIPLADVEAQPVKAIVKGVVTDETGIVKLKFPEITEETEEPVFPEETEMSFDELKVGERIDIATVDNISENIKNGTEFNISDIFIVE